MEQSKKTKRYEVTPASISLPMRPLLAEQELDAASLEGPVLINGLASMAATLETAEVSGEKLAAIIAHCKKLRGSEQVFAVVSAYEANPQVALDPWMCERLHTFVTSGRQLRRAGRPSGSLTLNPFLVVGLVHLLMTSGAAKSRQAAFRKLDADQILPFEIAESRYKQALNEPRFRATLFPDKKGAFNVEAEDEKRLAELLLKRGQPK